MKKGLKTVLIVLGVLVGLVLVVNIVAGPVVRAYAEKHSEELCHRKATIRHVRINLFTGKVAVVGLDVKEENGKDRFLYFDKLKVNVSLPRLLGRTVRVNRIMLNGLSARVIQRGDRFNFSDIIDFFTKDQNEKPDDGPSPWTVDIRNIHVKNSAVLYQDLNMGSKFDTKDVDIRVPRLRLNGGETKLRMFTAFRDGGDFSLNGGYDIQKGDFDAQVSMHDLSLALAWPYVRNLARLGSLSGKLRGDAHVSGCVRHIQDLVFSGTAGMENLKALNADKSPLLSFSSFELNIGKGDLGKKDFQINEVLLKDLSLNFDLYDDGSTISRLTGSPADRDSAAAEPVAADTLPASRAASDTRYLLKKLSVTNGKIVFADHSVSPEEQDYVVSDIRISAADLSNGKSSPITIAAKLGNGGELRCTTHVNPFDMSDADLNLSIKNLDIREFSPYSLHYFAYPVEDGLLAFTSDLTVRDNWLDSQNAIDIYKPAFGKKDKSITPAAAKIPMKAAIYIITDRKGHVRMDLPVKGDLSSPEFSFRKVIWKTFLNLMVKIAASPVDFIAKAVAGDEMFRTMRMPMDGEALGIEHTHQLNGLAEFLNEKKELTLELRLGAPEPDGVGDVREKAAMDKCYKMIRDYLVQRGVSPERISMGGEHKAHKTKEVIQVDFTPKYMEQ